MIASNCACLLVRLAYCCAVARTDGDNSAAVRRPNIRLTLWQCMQGFTLGEGAGSRVTSWLAAKQFSHIYPHGETTQSHPPSRRNNSVTSTPTAKQLSHIHPHGDTTQSHPPPRRNNSATSTLTIHPHREVFCADDVLQVLRRRRLTEWPLCRRTHRTMSWQHAIHIS